MDGRLDLEDRDLAPELQDRLFRATVVICDLYLGDGFRHNWRELLLCAAKSPADRETSFLPRAFSLIAVLVYAIPPVIRLTDLGIRLVDRDVLEAATAFGATRRQRLIEVQLPLALPTIMAGVNQTIMMALAMVVIASMIGVKGLGQPVLKSITNQYFTMGLLNGLAIVAIAIMFDRVSQAYARRTQHHLKGVEHD